MGCSRFFTKPDIDLWKDIFTGIGCNNITIFDYPSSTTRFAFTSNEWCYNLLYGSLENHIYMKIPEGFYLPNKVNSKEGYSIKLNKPFYWLKQSGRVWHNRLVDYLLKEGCINDLICSCIYMKRSKNEFAIIIVYVDDINIVGTPNGLTKAIDS